MMSQFSGNLLQLAKEHDVLEDPTVRKLVLAAGLSSNKHLQRSALKAILRKSVEQWKYPFDANTSAGCIRLGRCFDNRVLHLSEEELQKHLLAIGQSGAGKTTLFYHMADEVDQPIWFFDLKQDYRHLIAHTDLLVLPWSKLKFNPLLPPEDVPPRRWAQVFSEILGHSTSLLSGSKNYLLKSVIELYRWYGLFDEPSPPYPSMHELQVLLENDTVHPMQKRSNYRETVLNRLEVMNLTAGSVFDCSQGYSIARLLQQDVVFEFDGLNRDIQNFLMEILFAYVYEYRLEKSHRNTGLNHLFVLDEGKRVFSVYKERQDASGIPEIDDLTAKMREFGEGLIVGDQEASKLTDSIKANTFTKVLLPTADRKQFNEIADSMNLSERQREYVTDFGTGEAVVQVGNEGPFPVTLDDYNLEKSISDRELEKNQREKWSQLSYAPRELTQDFKTAIASEGSAEIQEPEVTEETNSEVELDGNADRLLSDIIENPFRPLTERYSGFSSRYKGNKAKNQLVDAGVVIERQIHAEKDKRKLLQLTEKGREYVECSLNMDPEQEGRGSIVHRYWQKRIRQTFEEAGWHAFVEKFDADVYVNMDEVELVIEVAMGNNQREVEHIKKHLSRFDIVWVACRNEDVRDRLTQRLEEKGLSPEAVVFRLVREFSEPENIAL